MPTIVLGGVEVRYTVERRPRRRQAVIQIDGEGTVRLLLPPGSKLDAERALTARADWILHHLADLETRPRAPGVEMGARVLYQGVPLTLDIRDVGPASRREPAGWQVFRVGDALVLRGPRGDTWGPRAALAAWFLREAHRIIPPVMAREAKRLGTPAYRLRLREYKTRWGTCRQDGLVTINWRLMGAPPVVLTYVVVHELVHLQHAHHQEAFWDEVESQLPDAEMSKVWLRRHGQELFW